MADRALLVFVKAPRPGTVKTRLVPLLGPERAARLARALADAVVRATTPVGGDYDRLLFFTPADARAEVEAWLPGETWIAQQGDDLGARMAAAFVETFRRGAQRAVVVGSDAPTISRRIVQDALDALDDHDVVLAPAADGGYSLLALAGPQTGLFTGIAWSTPSVLTATVERAGVLGLSVRLLDVVPDIDTVADLRAHWDRLRALLPAPLAEEIEVVLMR